MLDINVDNNQA